MPTRCLFAVVLTSVLLFSAAGAQSATEHSLYERLGGGTAIAAISNDLIDRVSIDPRTSRTWRKVSLPRVKAILGEHLCSATGGPCTYNGDSMKDIHAGLDITQSEMYGMVEIMRDVMIKQGIGLRERNEVLALLAPHKRDVVTR
jgi:hemoglobin